MPLAVSSTPVVERVKAYRDGLFERWVEARRHAQHSEDVRDHQAVAEAYTAFMRAHLTAEERTQLDLEDEIARLSAENRRLRGQVDNGVGN